MKLKRIALATAVATALGLGAGQASADVYGLSAVSIDDLFINFVNSQGASANDRVTINNFNFTLQNTAVLNGVGVLTTATCGGTIASNTCSAATPTLDALAANAPGSAFNRNNNQVFGDGTFTVFGLGGGNWSNSDSVIYTSELTSAGANPTLTDQIAEANIASALSASASSLIQSITGFTLTFTVSQASGDPTGMVLGFLADPDMRAEILNELGIASAQANMAVSVRLTKDGTLGTGLEWAPDGTTTNNCITGGGVTCVETDDSESLNILVGTTTNNTSASHSWGPNVEGSFPFGIAATGLTAGNWTLTLAATTSTQLSRTNIPEPASLALVGLAMLGLGATVRRRKA